MLSRLYINILRKIEGEIKKFYEIKKLGKSLKIGKN